MTAHCTDPGSPHTHDTTVWFRLAYRSPLPLWKVVPYSWMTSTCPAWQAQREAGQ